MGGSAGAAVGTIFGGGQDSGLLGTGQYSSKVADPNRKDFLETKQQDERTREMEAALKASQKFKDPSTKINQAPQDQFRSQQMGLAQALQQQAAGQGPSLAGAQFAQARDAGIAQQMALAASARGQNAALGQRQVAQQAASMNQQAARDAGTARIQEQLAARDQLSGVLQQGRGQDIGLATSQAELQLQSALEAQKIRNQAQQYYQGQLMADAASDRQALMDYNQLKVQGSMSQNQTQAGAYNAAAQNRGGLVSGVGAAVAMASDENVKTGLKEVDAKDKEKSTFQKSVGAFSDAMSKKGEEDNFKGAGKAIGAGLMKAFGSGGGGAAAAAPAAAAASDKDGKKGVKSGDAKAKSFLDALKAYEYQYKDPEKPGRGEGTFISPMAQDLEKTELGAQAVVDTPDGKMVDYGKLGGAMLASQTMLNERLNTLEAALKAKKGKK